MWLVPRVPPDPPQDTVFSRRHVLCHLGGFGLLRCKPDPMGIFSRKLMKLIKACLRLVKIYFLFNKLVLQGVLDWYGG